MDILEWVAQAMPNAMESLPSNEFVNLVIVFLGSPAYIKNAHLRAKLVDVSARFALLCETIFRDVCFLGTRGAKVGVSLNVSLTALPLHVRHSVCGLSHD